MSHLNVKCNEGYGLQNVLLVRSPYEDPNQAFDIYNVIDKAAKALDDPLTHITDQIWGYLGFKVNNQDDIGYAYTCIKLKNYGNCRSLTNPKSDGNLGQTEYLDRQSVFAGDNEILTGFKLNAVKTGIYWSLNYDYSVCELY